MAKKIDGYIKLQVPAGAANPSPPIGPALGQRGVNIMEFCKAFNAATQNLEKGMPIPTVITVYSDRSFTFITKTPPASYYLKKAAKLDKALEDPGPRHGRFRDAGAGARDRRGEEGRSERRRSGCGGRDDQGFCPLYGPRGSGVVAMAKVSKRMQKARDGLKPGQEYSMEEALKLVKERAATKLDETVDIAMNLGVDPRHSDQMVRGTVQLPHGTGKAVRVAVFAKDAKAKEAKDAGADIVGAEDLAEKIQAGEMNFDRVIATPDMMAVVGRLGKVLGPRGLMPNPKLGTVTPDVKGAIEAAKGGQVEFRVEKAGIIHAGVGKVSFDLAALAANVRAFADAVIKAKPAGAKGSYLKRVSLSSTMGPGFKIDPASLSGA